MLAKSLIGIVASDVLRKSTRPAKVDLNIHRLTVLPKKGIRSD